MPDVDDVRGASLAAIHALTNAAMIVGVPVLVGRRLATGRGRRERRRPLEIAAAAALVGAGLTFATRRFAWALVRLWLRMDESPRDGRLPRDQPPSM
jgi:hypothetical protein